MTGTPVLLEVRNLSKSFGDHTVLDNISFEVKRGEVIAAIGASGSGKSTLLRCLNLLETVSDGQVFLSGRDITHPSENQDTIRQQIGLVFQSFNLFAHLTVAENIALALRKVQGKSKAEAREIAMTWLTRIQLDDKADWYPDKLSGGQQQRAAIARAVALDPAVLLLDEVTSALDPELVGEVLELIRELKSAGTTIIMATHELSFARDVADRVMFLDRSEICEIGPSKEFFANPRETRTREFLARLKG
jgi:ABC-type polar amino acid transport system ATPase subunit